MAWYDDWYYNITGRVSPDQVANIKAQTNADIARAGRGLDPAVIAEQQRQANQNIDSVLATVSGGSAAPTAPVHIPGISEIENALNLPSNSLRYGLYAVGALLVFVAISDVTAILPRRK